MRRSGHSGSKLSAIVCAAIFAAAAASAKGETRNCNITLGGQQASYDGLVQKLAEANAALEAFALLISKDAFEQAPAMLSRGDVLGAERKFVEIAKVVAKIRKQADVVEARALQSTEKPAR